MANDFYINFGSNAPQFARKLKTDLEKAHEPIQLLEQLLDNLDTKGQRVLPPLFHALNKVGEAANGVTGGGGGGGGGGGAPSVDAMDRAVDAFRSNLDAMAGELRGIVKSIGEVTRQQGRVNRGRGAYVDPDQNWRIVKTADVKAGLHPNAIRMGTARLSQDTKLIAAIERLAGGGGTPQATAPRVGDVTKVQLDQAALDRVVSAIHEVRDEIQKLGTRPLQTVSGGTAAPATTTTAKTKKGKAAKAEAETQDLLAVQAELQQQVATLEVQAARMVAQVKQAGGTLDDGLAAAAEEIETALSGSKAMLARIDRETTGITKREQKRRRREGAEAERGPDLAPDEWEKRARIRQRLDLALDPKAFETAVGTGKGQLLAKDLRELGVALSELGYEVKTTSKTTVPQMTKGIIDARQAMLADYGANVPESLRLGRKIRPDVVSEDVQDFLASLNISPEQAEVDRLDRERRRKAFQAGYVPDEATQRNVTSPPVSKLLDVEDLPSLGFAMSEELQKGLTKMSRAFGTAERQIEEMWTSGGSFVRVPNSMVKGGQYDDRAFGYNEATEALRQRMLGTVAGRAAVDPNFNPLQFDPYEHITGPNAKENRQVLFAARRAIDELDVLGREFIASADAVEHIDEYLKRARARLEREARGGKLSDEDRRRLERDRTDVPVAEARRAELLREMQSAKYQTLGLGADVLETPEYRQGLLHRDVFRARQQTEIDARPERERMEYIGDALGRALIGARLAPGTRDTTIKNLPGARWDRRKQEIAFIDPGERKAQREELAELNQARRRVEKLTQRTIPAAEKALAAGEDPGVDIDKLKRRAENAATSLLGHIQSIFGRSMSIEDILGHGGTDAEGNRVPYQFISQTNAQKEADRLDKRQRQATAEAESVERAKGTKEEKATASLVDAKHRLAVAIRKQEEQTAELTKLEAELEANFNNLSKTDRELVRAADARLKRLQAERNALENAWHPRVPEKMDERQEPNYKAADATRAYVQAQRDAVASLVRQERSQRGVVTRYQKLGITGEKVTKAEERLAATTERLATERANLERLEHQAPTRISAAEGGARAEARLANQYRDRGHSPGEPLDVMGYPSRLGYNADAETRKKQLDQELERARAERARVLGVKRSEGEGARDVRAELVEELERRKAARPDITSKIASAREEGDLKENAGYHAAMEEQGRNEARIKQIQAQLTKEGLDKYDKLAEQIESTNKVIAHLTGEVAKAEQRLVKAGGKAGREASAPNAADRPQADTAEARDLRDRIKAAEDLRRQVTQLRDLKRKAAASEKAAIQAQIDELKKAPGYLLKPDLESKRKRLFELNRAAGGAGDGGNVPPTARGGAGGGPRDGGGGANEILRQILAAINGVHDTIRTGVRVTGGEAVTRPPAVPATTPPRTPTTPTAPVSAPGGDEQVAMTAAETRRALREVRQQKRSVDLVDETERLERKRAEQQRRSLQLTRAQAREDMALREAMSLLNAEAEHELSELRALNAAGAENTKIVEQQARAYAAMDKAMHLAGVQAGDRRSYAQTLLSHANVRPGGEQGPRVSRSEVDDIARSARGIQGYSSAVEGTFTEMAGFAGQDGPFGRALQAMFGGHGFWARIMASTGTFIVRNFTAGFVFGITNALQDVVAQAILTEATFIRVSHALEETGRDVGSLRSDLQGISTEYGTSLNDVYEVAAGLTGLFDNTEDLAAATKVVSQLEMISMGALNAKEAMGALASIQGAFAHELGTGVDGLEHVADVLTSVQNNVGTNVEVTAEAVGRMSGLAHQLGLSFEEVSVYGAQIAKLTNQTGAAAGEQFSRILASMQTGRGRSAISEAFGNVNGRRTGVEGMLGARDYSGVLRVMQREWGNLTTAQQQNVAVSLAGQRQAAAFAALMHNGSKTLAAITKAQYSYGDAQERTAALMNTLNKQIDKLQTNFQNLANNLVRTGVLNFLGLVLKTTNLVLGSLNHLLSTANDFADSNPLLKWIKEVGFGVIGMVLAISLLQRAFRGLKATFAGLPMVKQFREGAAAPAGAPTVRDAVRERASRTLGTVTGASRANFGADVRTGAVARGISGALDRYLVRPVEYAGNQVTRFGQVMRTHAEQIVSSSVAAQAGGRALPETQLQRQAGRVAMLSRTSAVMGGLGGFIAGGAGFTSDVLRGRGPERFANLSEGLRARQERYGIVRQFAQGEGGSARQAAYYGALSKSAGAAAKITDRVGSSLNGLAKSGVGADAAMMAVGAVITGFIMNMQANAEAAEGWNRLLVTRWKNSEAGKARLKEEGRKEEAPGEYMGPSVEEYQRQTKVFSEQGNALQAGFQALGKFTGDSLGNIAHAVSFGKVGEDKTFKESFEEMTGTEGGKSYGLDKVQKKYDKALANLRKQADLGGTSKDFLKSQKDFEGELNKMIDEVENNKDLSDQQRTAAAAAADQASYYMQREVENVIATSEGLKSAGLLELEQLQRIGETQDILGKLQGQGGILKDFAGGLDALRTQETGVDENNPELLGALDALSTGGLGSAEAAKAQTTIIRERAKQAEIKYLAALQTNDTEGLDDKRGTFLQLMDQLAAQTQQQIQIFVQTSTALADQAAQLGDYTGSEEALKQGIADLESLKKGQTVSERGRLQPLSQADQEFNANIEAQQRGLNQRVWEQAGNVQNRTLQMQAAQGQGQVASARNNLQQQKNVLAAMQQAHEENAAIGPTADQIHQQEMAVAQAKFQLGQQMASRDVAQMMLAAAGIWNEAQAAQAAEDVAAAQLQQAIDQYGRGSVEAMNARANLRNARKSAMQAEDAEAQAARDAAVAAIPQGNAVAIARQQVANAYAALKAAEKYGTSSTQYQGALAQLYSAQQDAMHATQAVAQAQNQVAVAMAEASGNTVRAAVLQLRGARLALAQALKNSGGAQSTEVLQARAQVIQARAAARDARLQDELDTIDFNLQMGKITQSSAISALREILRTHNLTKQQRRQLLLQIKGMEKEISDSPWNFGDIKLPKPYLMKRYIEEQRDRNTQRLDAMVGGSLRASTAVSSGMGAAGQQYNDNRNVEILINGGNLDQIRKVLREVVGTPTRTRTTAPRRGRR